MTHYEALELPEHAQPADIRRAYRRLVLLTHPDRTPDPAAHARYLAIYAAYEVLSDPGRRAEYDNERHRPSTFPPAAPSPGQARDAAYRARRAGHARRPAPSVAAPYAAEYARALRLARPLLIASLALGTGLVIDLALAVEHRETVTDAQTIFLSRRDDTSHTFRYWTERGLFSINAEVPMGTRLLVRRTPVRGTAISARFSAAEPSLDCNSLYTGPRSMFWIGLLLSALAGLAPVLTADQRLVASLANVVFFLTTVMQLF